MAGAIVTSTRSGIICCDRLCTILRPGEAIEPQKLLLQPGKIPQFAEIVRAQHGEQSQNLLLHVGTQLPLIQPSAPLTIDAQALVTIQLVGKQPRHLLDAALMQAFGLHDLHQQHQVDR